MKKILNLLLTVVIATAFLSGCASVPMESSLATNSAKEFKTLMCQHTNVFTEIFTHMINSNTINLSLISFCFALNWVENNKI